MQIYGPNDAETLDNVIRKRLFKYPKEWAWDGPRFLRAPGVVLVRALADDRWTFIVGKVGFVKLSLVTHWQIELARAMRCIPDIRDKQNEGE